MLGLAGRGQADETTFAAARVAFEAAAERPGPARAALLRALGRHRTGECARYLADVHGKDGDPAVRLEALRLLGAVGADPARALLERVADGGPPAERPVALEALARLTPPPPLGRFLAALDPDHPDPLRLAAARALARYPEPGAADALAAVLVDAAAPAALGRAATDALRTSVRQGPVAAWLVERALARRTPFLAAAPALLALAPRCGDARIGAVVQEWLAHPLAPARRAACDALAELALAEPARVERTGALDALAGRVEDADPEVALSAVVAIGRIGPAGAALEAVLELAEERRGGLRAAAVAALAHARDPRALEAAREALEAKAAPVQLAAIATLRALGGRPAVDALVEALRHARGGRLEAELLATLRALTHANPGDEAAAWRKWWRAVREDYDFGSLPASAPRRGDEGGATRTRGVPTYYGAEVVSRRVTFVVDVSGSMSADVKGAGADRLELCKRELLGVIAALPKRACFNLIPFNGAFEPWQPRLVPASAAARAAARAFVEGLQAGGGTNIYDPLEAALLDPQVDTIYLLTDGAPSAGKFVVPAEILREVRRLNAARQVAIHTISVGGRSPLLRQLAEENGGRYAAR